MYYKWKNLWSHSITNYAVFWNAIHDGLTKGHLIFGDKGKPKFGVDKDPFQNIAALNIVEVGQSKTPCKKVELSDDRATSYEKPRGELPRKRSQRWTLVVSWMSRQDSRSSLT